MKRLVSASLATLVLTLTACDGANEVPTAEIETEAGTDFAVFNDDAYPVASPLNEQQQSNLDAMDRDAVASEYDTIRVAMTEEAAQDSSSMNEASPAAGASMDPSSTATPATESAGTMRPRSQMDFAFLDRNDDNQLSVAEYAIWAVRADPTEPKPNDEKRPYISPEQINEAGTTFFYFDNDGDTYLSSAEFDQARASARTP